MVEQKKSGGFSNSLMAGFFFGGAGTHKNMPTPHTTSGIFGFPKANHSCQKENKTPASPRLLPWKSKTILKIAP